MYTWNFGPCRRRSRLLEEIDKPDTPEEILSRVFEFRGFLDGGLGGNRVVLNFLKEASRNWPSHRSISILELRCGRGDLSAAIVRWARKKKIDIQILAVDDCPAVISLARDYHGSNREIVFESRLLTDPRFLEAQQFDYVVSSSALHSLDSDQVSRVLKMANLQAKRGIIFCDWIRDLRAWMWMQMLARFWGDEVILHDAALAIRKGFTLSEIKKIVEQTDLEYLELRKHFAYRFSMAGERGLVLSPEISSVARLAGA